jgi:hypothetical protein
MSHKVGIEQARAMFERELVLRQMLREGKVLPVNDRKRKRYEEMRSRQDGFWWRMRDRVKGNRGKLSMGFMTEEEKKKKGVVK